MDWILAFEFFVGGTLLGQVSVTPGSSWRTWMLLLSLLIVGLACIQLIERAAQ